MTGRDAEVAAARLSLHLRKNQFEACHNILYGLEAEITSRCPVNIAELNLNLRWVNALEKLEYIKISDLDDVNWESLRMSIVCLGPAGTAEIKLAVEDARKRIKLEEEICEAELEAQLYQQSYD